MNVCYIAKLLCRSFISVGIVGHHDAIQGQMSNHSETDDGRMASIVIGDGGCVVLTQIDDNAGHRR